MKKTVNLISGVLVLTVCGMLVSCGGQEKAAPAEDTGNNVTKNEVPVKIITLGEREFRQILEGQGSLLAEEYVVISSRLTGTVQDLYVDDGSIVKANETQLAHLDDRNLKHKVALASAGVESANAGVKVAEANVLQAKAKLKKATLDRDRYVRLHDGGVATDNEIEQFTSQFDQIEAGYQFALAQVEDAKARVSNATAALAIAEKDLSDAVIFSPINGTVVKKDIEAGEETQSGKPMFWIEDTTALEAQIFFPSIYYDKIEVGKTKLELTILGKKVGSYTVTYKSPTIEKKLRTFEVKAAFKNDRPDLLIIGAMIDVEAVLDVRKGFAVPTHAILQREGGSQILCTVDGKTAKKVLVTCGYANDGWTEVSGEGLEPGLSVVVEGQYALDDGGALRVIK